MVPVVAAAALSSHRWSGGHAAFHVDNMAVVAVLQHQAPRNLFLTHMLLCLCLYAAFYGFEFSAFHTPGKKNLAAHAMSCDDVTLSFTLFSQVPHSPTPQVKLPGMVELFNSHFLRPGLHHHFLIPLWSLKIRNFPCILQPTCSIVPSY